MVTQNLDKATGVVNGQLATIVDNQGRTLILQLPNDKHSFKDEDEQWHTMCMLVLSYAMTIPKSEGTTIDKLIVWMDCEQVPLGLGYVALSCLRPTRYLLLDSAT